MFDFWNVVGICDTPRIYSLIRDHRQNDLEPREIFTGSLREINARYDRGEISSLYYFWLLKRYFKFKDLTIEDFFHEFGNVLTIDREMLEIRDDLRRKGIQTALVTNMNSFHVNYLRRNYPEVFSGNDYDFISCEEKIAKPNPEALIRTLDHRGFRAEEAILVDDYYVNIEEYCRLGVKGWHYNVTDQYYCQNGKLEEERQKLRNYLNLLWNRGILKPR